MIRQECRTEIEVSYQTQYDEECETVTKSECHPVVKQVPDKKCHTAYEKACSTHYKTTYVHSYAKFCKPVHKEVSTYVTVRSPSRYKRGFYNFYEKRIVWLSFKS